MCLVPGAAAYDERLTRFRLRQAFGRLVRRADDRGVFVLLDRAFPSRLHGAFPAGGTVERIGLADAVEATRGVIGLVEGMHYARQYWAQMMDWFPYSAW